MPICIHCMNVESMKVLRMLDTAGACLFIFCLFFCACFMFIIVPLIVIGAQMKEKPFYHHLGGECTRT